MLKKSNRLAKDADIKTALARGRNFFNPFFTLKFQPQPVAKRFTVVVSTKVFKKAVERNRLKRIVREHIRKNLGTMRTGHYVIIAKPKLAAADEPARLKAFLDVLGRLR